MVPLVERALLIQRVITRVLVCDWKSTRLNSRLTLHDALPILLTSSVHGISSQLTHRAPYGAARGEGSPDSTCDYEGARVRLEEHTSELPSYPTRRSSDLTDKLCSWY